MVFHTCLSHVPGPDKALTEAFRVLRPNGRLVILEGDYATTTVATGPEDPLQACVDAAVSRLVHDRWLVRQTRTRSLRRQASRLGLFESYGYVQTRKPDYMMTLVTRGADFLVADGKISSSTGESSEGRSARASGGRGLLRLHRLRRACRDQARLTANVGRISGVAMSEPSQLKEIDACEVLVLVDNVSDPLSTVPQGVTWEIPNLLRAGATELAGSCMCCAQWGLSLVLTANTGDQRSTLLFELRSGGIRHRAQWRASRSGFRDDRRGGAVARAFRPCGRHDDRTRADFARAKGRRPTPVHVNAGMFVDRATVRADGSLLPLGKVPSPAELEAAGGELVVADDARLLLDRAFYLSGEIPRVTPYEQGLKGQVRSTPGGGWEPDELVLDERFLAVHLRDRGIFVFTACSHAGIVNVLSHARELFDPISLYGVMGGFHLSGSYCKSIISETIEGLRGFGLKRLVPGHCTGWRATARLVDDFRRGEGDAVGGGSASCNLKRGERPLS